MLPASEQKTPLLFIGHGSPTNGIEHNVFSNNWKTISQEISRPKAVICVSAHWLTRGTHITAMENPRTIHDFGGFQKELYEVEYPAPGSLEIANQTRKFIQKTDVGLDHDWGLDHGTWTVLRHMYPDADIPVLQLSIDYHKPAQYHYELGQELAELRQKGVLVVGSGNMVHNLGMIAYDKMDEPGFGYDWAIEMNELFKRHILENNHKALIDYRNLNDAANLAIPTPDHYFPLLYILGMQGKNESLKIFNDQTIAGSISMTSVIIS